MSATRVATGFSRPVFGAAAPGDSGRLFIVEQRPTTSGRIRILNLDTGTINPTPFLSVTVSGSSQVGDERGLLGLAFHPDYANNGLFYVNFTNAVGSTEVREYQRLNNDQANAASGRTLLTIGQPFTNHNGGWMGFGPDGFLYIATGDGGAGGDPGNRSQDITNQLLGKMLRIDPLGDNSSNGEYGIPASNPFVGVTGDDEIWAYGLRNPWRCSFDSMTGDLYIADVGQNAREEIDVQLASSSGGENYGWRRREGTIAYPGTGGGTLPSAINPIYNYVWGSTGRSVTGGYVYRGPIGEIQGHYFFADYVSSRIWSLKFDGSNPSTFNGTNYTNFIEWTSLISTDIGNINSISSFAEDELGNLYIIDLGGEVFKIEEAMISTAVDPDSVEVTRGVLVSGGLSELETSDDVDYQVRIAALDSQSRTEFQVKGVSPVANPTLLGVTLEGALDIGRDALSKPSSFGQVIEFYNYDDDVWEVIDSRPPNIRRDGDPVVVDATGDLSRFVEDDTLCIEARVRFTSSSPKSIRSETDQFIWRVF